MLEVTAPEDGVRLVELARPERYNALDGALLDALAEHLGALDADSSVRAVVLAGRGRGFCAGHDLRELLALPDGAARESLFRRCADVMLALRHLHAPVIAAVEGTATAAGCQLVASCDLAVAARDARFATPGVDIGLFCSTPMVPLARVVPPRTALRMLLTGEAIDAERALATGLVSDLAAPGDALDDALSLARVIAGKSTEVVVAGKARFHALAGLGEREAYAVAVPAMAEELDRPAARKGIAAFLEGRRSRSGSRRSPSRTGR